VVKKKIQVDHAKNRTSKIRVCRSVHVEALKKGIGGGNIEDALKTVALEKIESRTYFR
jgi:hypothetical protein